MVGVDVRGVERVVPLAATILALTASLLLGGGTSTGFLSDVGLQLLAAPLLAVLIWWAVADPARLGPRRGHFDPMTVVVIAAIVALPLIQIAPLPGGLWSALPGRELVLEAGRGQGGFSASWRPLSVAPSPISSPVM